MKTFGIMFVVATCIIVLIAICYIMQLIVEHSYPRYKYSQLEVALLVGKNVSEREIRKHILDEMYDDISKNLKIKKNNGVVIGTLVIGKEAK